ncbi:MAG: hypothetical protein OJF59_001108 [Cytophagales bacterium]|nr:MAG: hypothetical protein OJF59_001108 [Cytophagales bacterium]
MKIFELIKGIKKQEAQKKLRSNTNKINWVISSAARIGLV